jgi:hypothetical protein
MITEILLAAVIMSMCGWTRLLGVGIRWLIVEL